MKFGELKKWINATEGADDLRVVVGFDYEHLDDKVGFSSIGPAGRTGETVMVFIAADVFERAKIAARNLDKSERDELLAALKALVDRQEHGSPECDAACALVKRIEETHG